MTSKSQCFAELGHFYFKKWGLAKFTPAVRISGMGGNGDTRSNLFIRSLAPVTLLAVDSALWRVIRGRSDNHGF